METLSVDHLIFKLKFIRHYEKFNLIFSLAVKKEVWVLQESKQTLLSLRERQS